MRHLFVVVVVVVVVVLSRITLILYSVAKFALIVFDGKSAYP